MSIEWSAGSNGIRQTVHRTEDNLSLSVILTDEGIILDLVDADGEVIGTKANTYEEIMEELR